MNVLDTVARKFDVRAAQPKEYVRQRIAESAAELSHKGYLAARLEIISEALHRLCGVLYELDSDGGLANVDRVTHRILVPLPWGSSGWNRWSLRAWEAEALRNILRTRQASEARIRPPLFDYNDEGWTWHLNYSDYPGLAAAQFYLQREPIRLAELRSFHDGYRMREAERKRKRYGRAIGKASGDH